MSTWKINLKEQTATSINGITFNLPGLHPIIGEKINIRVNGIDTPEIRGKCDQEKYNAKQAKAMVTD